MTMASKNEMNMKIRTRPPKNNKKDDISEEFVIMK
jgi:hypothetical protein